MIFIADEVFHVELANRLAMEIGGGAPVATDFAQVGVRTPADLSPMQRANDLVLRVACVSETLSGVMAVETMREISHRLVPKIMERIARDEARHTRLGWLYLHWAQDQMTDDERRRLSDVATREILALSPLWRDRTSTTEDGVTSEGYKLDDVRDFGWMESRRVAQVPVAAVKNEIAAPLEKYGILMDPASI